MLSALTLRGKLRRQDAWLSYGLKDTLVLCFREPVGSVGDQA